MHQYLIFNTAAGIGSQAHALIRSVCIYPLDQSYRPNGDQIIQIVGLGIVFLYYVRHKSQIVFDQNISGLHIAVCPPFKVFLLLRTAEGLGKGVPRSYAQHQKDAVHQKDKRSLNHSLTSVYSIRLMLFPIPRPSTAKRKCKTHFLFVRSAPASETFIGIW